MNANQIKEKMSKGEWRIDDEGRVTDDELCTVLHTSESAFNTNTNRANELAIVSAVNGTFGKGLNPEMYEPIIKALERLMDGNPDHFDDAYDTLKDLADKAKL